MTNIDQARLAPTSVFHTPEDVLATNDLSREQKIDILRRWEYDARALEVAEEEGMVSSQPDILDRVLQALHTLNIWHDPERAAPPNRRAHERRCRKADVRHGAYQQEESGRKGFLRCLARNLPLWDGERVNRS